MSGPTTGAGGVGRRPIILDCDPGLDDAFAILLAAASPAIDLRAITTVAGNHTVDRMTLNARRICTVAGIRGVPIAQGCDRPLVRAQIVGSDIHGESGLDGPAFGPPVVDVDPRHAVDLIVELIMAAGEPMTLVAIGPLTNVATALRREPRLASRLREISLMGGAWGLGNRTPAAEFNIVVDPEAARIVFESGVPLTMCGLELTHQVIATPDIIGRVAALGTAVGDMCAAMLRFYGDTTSRRRRSFGPALHDPTAVAWLIDPTMFEAEPMHVDIETSAEFSYGRTLVDVDDVLGLPKNATVPTRIDAMRFWDLLLDALATYR
ncbi:MAG: nucleoside hydrolase [Chloroflexi bacterium]|nr:nucleoside hydrolase [Chloroflexota bacterium]